MKRKILLPALLDEVEIPLEFRLIQSVLLVDWQGGIHHPEVGRLVDVVERVLGISRKKATDETLKQENKETGLRLGRILCENFRIAAQRRYGNYGQGHSLGWNRIGLRQGD